MFIINVNSTATELFIIDVNGQVVRVPQILSPVVVSGKTSTPLLAEEMTQAQPLVLVWADDDKHALELALKEFMKVRFNRANKIEAIKLVRSKSHTGLLEAKLIVELVEAGLKGDPCPKHIDGATFAVTVSGYSAKR
jgi:ribosomal protein L7/L12